MLQVCATPVLVSSRRSAPQNLYPPSLVQTPPCLLCPTFISGFSPSSAKLHNPCPQQPAPPDPTATKRGCGSIGGSPTLYVVDQPLPLHTHLFSWGVSSHCRAGGDPRRGLGLTKWPSIPGGGGRGGTLGSSMFAPCSALFAHLPSHLHLQTNTELYAKTPSPITSARRVPLPQASSKEGLAAVHPVGATPGSWRGGKPAWKQVRAEMGAELIRLDPFGAGLM